MPFKKYQSVTDSLTKNKRLSHMRTGHHLDATVDFWVSGLHLDSRAPHQDRASTIVEAGWCGMRVGASCQKGRLVDGLRPVYVTIQLSKLCGSRRWDLLFGPVFTGELPVRAGQPLLNSACEFFLPGQLNLGVFLSHPNCAVAGDFRGLNARPAYLLSPRDIGAPEGVRTEAREVTSFSGSRPL
jgi:hypothetical protein